MRQRPVAYESEKLSSAERNYTTGEQELFAVVHAMRTCRCYLEGVDCTIVTDHNPLVCKPKLTCPGAKLGCQSTSKPSGLGGSTGQAGSM